MLVKYYVALKFKKDSALYRTIDSFKTRFDPKYRSDSFPHMSLIAPFMMDTKNEADLIETLKEELISFFYGHEGYLEVKFKGLDVIKHQKKHSLFLNPIYNNDTRHCIDMVADICDQYIPKFL